MAEQTPDFEPFMREREAAARAYVNGDAAPLGRLVAQASPASFYGPGGGTLSGADKVASTYEHDAASFETGSETRFEVLQSGASGDLAYWTGIQRAKVRLDGKAEAIPMDLRITEVFRREGGAWKLIHRHADTSVEPTKK
jgi:ketosteroid isomerase-like protein